MKSSYMALALGLVFVTAGSWALGGAHPQDDKSKQTDSKQNDKYKVKLDLPPYTGPKKRLGVMALEIKVTTSAAPSPTPVAGGTTTPAVAAPTNTDLGTGLTEMLTTALIDSNRFVILERAALPNVQAEQALGATPTVNPAAATTAGHVLGAQALIQGAVTEFSQSSSSIGGGGGGVSSGGLGGALGGVLGQGLGNVGNLSHSDNQATVVLDIRIYDASTTQVLDSVTGTGKVKTSANSAAITVGNFNMGAGNFQNSPLGEAARRAIADCVKQICQRMEKYPWEARVADLEADGSALYINAGATMGIKVGDQFDVSHPGRDIVDPDSKTIIGRTKDTMCGHVRVDSVTAGVAIVKIVDGTGFAINDVVRFSTP